jgi:hypothetical protein
VSERLLLMSLSPPTGNTPALATSVVQTIDAIHEFAKQAKELEQEVVTLKIEVNEKAVRTTVSLTVEGASPNGILTNRIWSLAHDYATT